MRLTKLIEKMQLVTLLILLSVVASCQGVDYDEIIYVGDMERYALVNGKGNTISVESGFFNDMICTRSEYYADLLAYVSCLESGEKKRKCARKNLKYIPKLKR